jgi:putative SOS response-associated peptidase YedK
VRTLHPKLHLARTGRALSAHARNLRPRYNIAPTTAIDVVRLADTDPELVPMRWGLIPGWWKKPA